MSLQKMLTKTIESTDDIHQIIEELQEKYFLQDMNKSELTVMLTAASDIYRLFFNLFDKVHTEIYGKENEEGRIVTLSVIGTGISNGDKRETIDIKSIKKKVNHRLRKVKTIFQDYSLSSENENLVTLKIHRKFDRSNPIEQNRFI